MQNLSLSAFFFPAQEQNTVSTNLLWEVGSFCDIVSLDQMGGEQTEKQ